MFTFLDDAGSTRDDPPREQTGASEQLSSAHHTPPDESLVDFLDAWLCADLGEPVVIPGLPEKDANQSKLRQAQRIQTLIETEQEAHHATQVAWATFCRSMQMLNRLIAVRLHYQRLFNPLPKPLEVMLACAEERIVTQYTGQALPREGGAAPLLNAYSMSQAQLELWERVNACTGPTP